MSPDDPRHGTIRGAAAHQRDGEPTCDACRHAKTVYQKRRLLKKNNGVDLTVPSIGYIRRLQALARLGWTQKHIHEAGGPKVTVIVEVLSREPAVLQRKTAEAIDVAWKRLSGRQGPSAVTVTRAAQREWAPPLAWNDIDDPNERPKGLVAFTLCGTRSGYHAHKRRKEPICDPCRAANTERTAETRRKKSAA